MRRAIFNKGSTIRIPIQRSEQIRRLRNASQLFEILDLNERTVKRVSEISAEGRAVLPLDGPRRGRNESLLSQLRDEGAENPLEKLEMEEATAELREALTLS